ncbi:DUF3685 domain-containing protein [Candidatus Synechococcus spongiarum]|uniref:DUF3685 domain-containing protein n=1 Tax=Candidatus Synechococcus spongiarum TaxID=431041 RepID=A0A171DHE6_9SYNE|nr:DUF3685 domain-containing protein [Candidatus Synechococcus spongiarum]SAY39218.1 hypothetical protein FLM9_1288 [Candidatus Synechococcus spongiarum]
MGSLTRRVLVYAPLSQKKQLAAVLGRSNVEGVPVQCIDEAEATRRRPDLVIWVAQASPDAAALVREALALDQRWHPAPLLLVLRGPIQPGELPLGELPIAGILQNPDAPTLRQSLPVLMGGGRVFDVQSSPGAPIGKHQGLNGVFSQGLTQIQIQAKLVTAHLQQRPKTLLRWVLEGQQRELAMARTLVLMLHAATANTLGLKGLSASDQGGGESAPMSTGLTLRSRTATGLWDTLSQRLLERIAGNPQPLEQQLPSLGALASAPRTALLRQLLGHMGLALGQVRREGLRGEALLERWQDLQEEIMLHGLQELGGAYLRIPRNGVLVSVSEQLLAMTLPGPVALNLASRATVEPMLAALVRAEPVLLDGHLLAPDTPAALLHLEVLLSDWLLRMASALAGLVLEEASQWPELRRFLLRRDLLPTRQLERLRNHINSRERYEQLILEPLRIYESRRDLLLLQADGVATRTLVDPRDQELAQLEPLQRMVTLSLELRDALGPQLRVFSQRLGDLLVTVLTQIVGRGIGLIARGVLLGLGRTLQGSGR